MELGGNAPFIVFDDADLDAAVEGAMIAKMRNGGEACTAANRFYVAGVGRRRVRRRLAERDGRAAASGPGLDDGAPASARWSTTRRRRQGRRARRRRASSRRRTACSPAAPAATAPGFFYPPTVLDRRAAGRRDPRTRRSSGRSRRSSPFDDEDEAIELANDTEFGLVAYVYTGDLARGLRVGEALEAGMVGLNRGLVSDPAAPFGGVKQSGLGREGGHEGMLELPGDQVHRRRLVTAPLPLMIECCPDHQGS